MDRRHCTRGCCCQTFTNAFCSRFRTVDTALAAEASARQSWKSRPRWPQCIWDVEATSVAVEARNAAGVSTNCHTQRAREQPAHAGASSAVSELICSGMLPVLQGCRVDCGVMTSGPDVGFQDLSLRGKAARKEGCWTSVGMVVLCWSLFHGLEDHLCNVVVVAGRASALSESHNSRISRGMRDRVIAHARV